MEYKLHVVEKDMQLLQQTLVFCTTMWLVSLLIIVLSSCQVSQEMLRVIIYVKNILVCYFLQIILEDLYLKVLLPDDFWACRFLEVKDWIV